MARRIPLIALFTSEAISVTGNVMALIAIPWFVLEQSGSAALTGIVAFFTTLATVVASFFGGTLVDRLGFRRMSVVSDVASGLSIAAIPVLNWTMGGIDAWLLIALVFVGAMIASSLLVTAAVGDGHELAIVLRAAGLSDERVRELREQGAIA